MKPLERSMYVDFADMVFYQLFYIFRMPLDTYERNNRSEFLALRSSVIDLLNAKQVNWWHNIEGVNVITYMVFNRIDKHRIK